MVHPPHLPGSETDEVRAHTRSSVRMFIINTILGVGAGIVGALIVVAWLVPAGYVTEGLWVPRGQSASNSNPYTKPDASIERKVKNTTVSVFVDDQSLENGYYEQSSGIGEGVILSSNGWGVIYAPTLVAGAVVPHLRVRDVQNTWYTPTSVVVDKKYGFVYFKLSGTEFYVVSLPDWRALNSGVGVWVYGHGIWKRQALGDLKQVSEESVFAPEEERMRYELLPQGLSENGLVVNDMGNLLGFVNAEGKLQDAWIIEFSIPELLESGTLPKSGLEWKGVMVETVEEGKIVKGFLIDSLGKTTTSSVKRFDIIRAINNAPVNEYTLYRMVREKPLTATIWRDKKVFDILVNN